MTKKDGVFEWAKTEACDLAATIHSVAGSERVIERILLFAYVNGLERGEECVERWAHGSDSSHAAMAKDIRGISYEIRDFLGSPRRIGMEFLE